MVDVGGLDVPTKYSKAFKYTSTPETCKQLGRELRHVGIPPSRGVNRLPSFQQNGLVFGIRGFDKQSSHETMTAPRSSKWGSFFQQAVAGVEARLDNMLAEGEYAPDAIRAASRTPISDEPKIGAGTITSA